MSKHQATPLINIQTVVDLLRQRAIHQPKEKAYTFLSNSTLTENHINYAALDSQACAIAAQLQLFDVVGQRALLLYQPGLDYIAALFGCLYAGVIAVTVYPPNPSRLERKLLRLQAILADAQPTLVLTTSLFLPLAEALRAQAPNLPALRWLATDTIPADLQANWEAPELNRESLAFIQYTSGSTATPKGVMLSHGNILHNLSLICQKFELTPKSHGVIWLPPYHDMGLIGGVLEPLFVGFPVTLMSPATFLQRPFRWLQVISQARGTCSGGPNFAYELCVRKITPE